MIVAAADGSALGNPGPAGWAWYVDEDRWASGGWPHGTNNMGELMAVLDLLRQTADLDDDLEIVCDSTLSINTVTKWMAGWKRKGWLKADGKPPANLDLVRALDEQMANRRRRPTFTWVKGHAGHPLNEQADRLANAAAVAHRSGQVPPAGPGFGAVGGAAREARPEPQHQPRTQHRTQPQPERAADEPVADLFSFAAEQAVEPQTELVDDLDQVIALERALLTDEVRLDPARLDCLLHPRWSEIGSSGRLLDRASTLAGLAPVEATLEVVRAERVADGVILLLWRSASSAGDRLRSSLWVRDEGRWQQLFHQGTSVPPSTPPTR